MEKRGKTKENRKNLHGFGEKVPLVSSLNLMLDRTADLHLWLPADLEEPLRRDFEQYCYMPFKLIMHPLDTTKQTVLYEDKDVMEIKGIASGPQVKECLDYLLKLAFVNPLRDKEEMIKQLKGYRVSSPIARTYVRATI